MSFLICSVYCCFVSGILSCPYFGIMSLSEVILCPFLVTVCLYLVTLHLFVAIFWLSCFVVSPFCHVEIVFNLFLVILCLFYFQIRDINAYFIQRLGTSTHLTSLAPGSVPDGLFQWSIHTWSQPGVVVDQAVGVVRAPGLFPNWSHFRLVCCMNSGLFALFLEAGSKEREKVRSSHSWQHQINNSQPAGVEIQTRKSSLKAYRADCLSLYFTV